MLDLESLHIFCTVAREGGVIRAAHHLHRVPSNITTRIKQLEERLGVRLLQRQGRAVVLTGAGQALLGRAERLLQLAEETERELHAGAMKGPLRVGSLESAAGARLPPVLSAFHAAHPAVSFELHTGTTGALLQRLERLDIEAAFVSEPFELGAWSSRAVFVEELVLITAAPCARVRRPEALVGQSLVAFAQGCSYRRVLEDWLAAAGVRPARVLELASYHAIVACVAAGTGFAIVPRSVLDASAAGTAVVQHGLPAAWRRNKTHLVWAGEPSAPLQALLDLLPVAVPTRRGRAGGRAARGGGVGLVADAGAGVGAGVGAMVA
jgi:DNA-binding transcriptional LysR family regulator